VKYRKKPVVIDAFHFGYHNVPDWFMDKVSTNEIVMINCYKHTDPETQWFAEIKTLEGVMLARGGDYIIKGVQGEIYPCKQVIFEHTYEVVQ